MKFEIDKDQLLKSVNIADSVVSSKNVNSILSNCLFNFYKDIFLIFFELVIFFSFLFLCLLY